MDCGVKIDDLFSFTKLRNSITGFALAVLQLITPMQVNTYMLLTGKTSYHDILVFLMLKSEDAGATAQIKNIFKNEYPHRNIHYFSHNLLTLLHACFWKRFM